MINYTYHDQLPTKYESFNFGPMRSEVLLPNMQGIRPSISEELHSQSEAGRTNEQTVKVGPNTIYRMVVLCERNSSELVVVIVWQLDLQLPAIGAYHH
jgi:hypothetical protein